MTELHNGGGRSHMFHTIRFFVFFFVKEKLAANEGIFPIPHLFINTLNAKRSPSSWEVDEIHHRSKWPTTTLLCYQITKWLQELGICPSIWSGGIQHRSPLFDSCSLATACVRWNQPDPKEHFCWLMDIMPIRTLIFIYLFYRWCFGLTCRHHLKYHYG